eukprot:289764_1
MTSIRIIRLVRSFRAISAIKSLKILINTVFSSLKHLSSVLFLILFLFIIFGIIGVQIFKGSFHHTCFDKYATDKYMAQNNILNYNELDQNDWYNGMKLNVYYSEYFGMYSYCNLHNNPCDNDLICLSIAPNPWNDLISFDNIFYAIFVQFIIITHDGWSTIMYMTQDAVSSFVWIYFFFISFICSYFALQITLAVLVTQYTYNSEQQAECETLKTLPDIQSKILPSLNSVFSNIGKPINCNHKLNKIIVENEGEKWCDNIECNEELDEGELAWCCSKTCDYYLCDNCCQEDRKIHQHNALQLTPLNEDLDDDEIYTKFVWNDDMAKINNSQFQKLQMVPSESNDKQEDNTFNPPTLTLQLTKTTSSNKSNSMTCNNVWGTCTVPLQPIKIGEPGLNVDKLYKISTPLSGFKEIIPSFTTSGSARSPSSTAEDTETLKYAIAVNHLRENEKLMKDNYILSKLAIANAIPKKSVLSHSTHYICRQKIYKICENQWFDKFMLFCIILNAIIMMIHSPNIDKKLKYRLILINHLFTVIFFIEMIFKQIAYGLHEYFEDNFNTFDCIITIVSVIDLILYSLKFNEYFTWLLAFRILRVFRVISKIQSLQIVTKSLGKSIIGTAYLFLLPVFIVFIFASLGMALWRNYYANIADESSLSARHSFKSIGWSCITVFQVLTGDNWTGLMYTSIEITGAKINCIFFIAIIIFGDFILMNLFIAVLLTQINQTSEYFHQNDKWLLDTLTKRAIELRQKGGIKYQSKLLILCNEAEKLRFNKQMKRLQSLWLIHYKNIIYIQKW